MTIQQRKEKLITLLNEALTFYVPISYSQINNLFIAKPSEQKNILVFEKANPEWGLTNATSCAFSTLSLIASITDVLCEDRLAVKLNEKGKITEFIWYSETQEPNKGI